MRAAGRIADPQSQPAPWEHACSENGPDGRFVRTSLYALYAPSHAVLSSPDSAAERHNLPDVYGIVARLRLAVATMHHTYDHSIHPMGGSVGDGCHLVWVASHADALGGWRQLR
jgi:hypothetical protein